MTKKIERADLKYIAVLIAAIMIFTSIGVLFGDVQNGNRTYSPIANSAANPAGTLELTVPVASSNYYYFLYSNGSILTAMKGNSLSTIYTNFAYYNITYNGVLTNVLTANLNTLPSMLEYIASGLWITNSTASISTNSYNISTDTAHYNFPDKTSAGMFAGQYSDTISQDLSFVIGEGSSTGVFNGIVDRNNVNLYYIQNEIGQTSTITATPSGGTAPYSYQWYVDGSAVSGATSSSYSYTANSISQANIIAKITDSTGAVQWSEPDFIMTNAHTTVSMSGQQRSGTNTADVGQSILFTGSFTYNPYGISKNGIFTGTNQFASGTTTAASGSYTFGSAGTFNVVFYAVDTNGYNATYTMTYTIYADPIFSTLWTSNSVHTNNNIKTTDINIPIYISTNVSLGSGGYSYSWSGTFVSSANSNTLTYTPSAVSTSGYTITFTLTDSNGYSVSGTIVIIVNPALSVVITTTTTGQ